MKQQSAGRHFSPLGHIILIPGQLVFAQVDISLHFDTLYWFRANWSLTHYTDSGPTGLWHIILILDQLVFDTFYWFRVNWSLTHYTDSGPTGLWNIILIQDQLVFDTFYWFRTNWSLTHYTDSGPTGLWHIILIQGQLVFAFTPSFFLFHNLRFDQTGLAPTIYSTRGQGTNNYNTTTVWIYVNNRTWKTFSNTQLYLALDVMISVISLLFCCC